MTKLRSEYYTHNSLLPGIARSAAIAMSASTRKRVVSTIVMLRVHTGLSALRARYSLYLYARPELAITLGDAAKDDDDARARNWTADEMNSRERDYRCLAINKSRLLPRASANRSERRRRRCRCRCISLYRCACEALRCRYTYAR